MNISGRLKGETERNLRVNMQMIFQDPMACLNPRRKVGDIIAQGLDIITVSLCKGTGGDGG